METPTLEQIRTEKSLDRLYTWLDAELEGEEQPGIITALSHRIERIEDLMLDMRSGACPIPPGYDA